MKRIFTIPVALLLTSGIFLPGHLTIAQSPQKMSYQALIRNNNNSLVTSATVSMRISILQASPTVTAVYVETQTASTNVNGLVTIEIGTGVTANNFGIINWANGPYFIKTETDPSGGTNYTITGTSQLLSVPYALFAKSAESVSGVIPEIQNLADVIAVNNSANGQIKNLTEPTEKQDAVTKAYVDELKEQINELQVSAGIKIKDADGNVYAIVNIGSQTWMAENLKTSRYHDGTPIPLVTSNTDWSNLESPGYCWYNNDEANYKNTRGALYNWYTVAIGKLCPAAWHVPSDAEWTTLTDYLINNGYGYEGSGNDIAKSMAATSGWYNSGIAGTVGNDQTSNNSSGFSAIACGYRDADNGGFGNLNFDSFWWTATEIDPGNGWTRKFNSSSSLVDRIDGFNNKQSGFSVRCLKD